MNRNRSALVMAEGALLALPALGRAQQPEMTAQQKAEMEAYMKAGTPGAPHTAMAATAGTYEVKAKSWDAPGAPVKGSMMGMPFTGHGMRGYDNVTGKYWATWMDTMSTGMMMSEGTCDAKNTCTFTGTYNDPIKKGPVTSRMTSRWTSATTEVFEMHGPARDGKEFKMMELTYTRK